MLCEGVCISPFMLYILSVFGDGNHTASKLEKKKKEKMYKKGIIRRNRQTHIL